MEKTLKIIQTLSRVGEILSRIVYILCIVGLVVSAVGLASFAAGIATISISGTSFEIILHEAGVSAGTVYASLVVAMILCGGEIAIAWFAIRYFRREQQDGTPFDLGGAKELLRLGILQIGITLLAQILAAVTHGVISAVCADVRELSLGDLPSIMIGISMILMSLIFRYGAERCDTSAPHSEG